MRAIADGGAYVKPTDMERGDDGKDIFIQ